jgi:BirA family biotin operon repressor/biotin-[acetyl-CoA-carboxylase] ligase
LITVIPETGSTNADLLARLAARERVNEGDWLVANRQSAGRGRQGRSWLDAPGNFMGSTVVHVSPQDPPAATLSFVAALAVYETVAVRLGNPRELELKWPNDVLLGGDKFCGLLLERSGETVVIGIGVNLAAAPAVEDRRTRALAEYGPVPDRDAFAAALADQFDLELGRWRQYGLEPILNRWLAAAHPLGTPLTVNEPAGTTLSGTFAGLERDGALRLRLADGAVRIVHAGDVFLNFSQE